jgi:hypothetical protein
MRIRAIVAIILLTVPAASSAQRIPVLGGRRGTPQPPSLPPQPGPIARELAYKRWRLSFESYPLVSFIQSPGFSGDGRQPAWATLGTGTRADYRLTPHVSATLDVTSSFIGGPAYTQTAELGTRFRPERSDRRVYPFLDLRVGYISAYSRGPGGVIDDAFNNPPLPGTSGSRFSQGFGAIGGVGLEYALTRRFSLTTAGSIAQHRLTAPGLQNGRSSDRSFSMTTLRYTLGIIFNPVTLVRPSGTDLP